MSLGDKKKNREKPGNRREKRGENQNSGPTYDQIRKKYLSQQLLTSFDGGEGFMWDTKRMLGIFMNQKNVSNVILT